MCSSKFLLCWFIGFLLQSANQFLIAIYRYALNIGKSLDQIQSLYMDEGNFEGNTLKSLVMVGKKLLMTKETRQNSHLDWEKFI